MAFTYHSNATAIVNVLKTHNTTTADPYLADGMSSTIADANIRIGDPEVEAIREADFPCIFVRISNKQEEFDTVGNTGPSNNKKMATVSYDIIGLYGREGRHTPYANLLENTYHMAENIEGVFQANVNLSSTALWCNAGNTDFLGPLANDDGTIIRGCHIQLEARYLFR